jgi:membrane peptidoglycan carboxypeptidase
VSARARSSAPSRRQARKQAKAQAKADGTRRSFVWRWRRGFFLVGLVLVAGVAGIAYVFSQVPLPAKDPPLLQTSFVCAADVTTNCNADNAMAQLSGGVDRVDVDYSQIPPVLVDAVVSAEDKNFFTHGGVDPESIARALWEDLHGSASEQGGSTITQQYVKTVYLTNERSVTRKIKEAVLAVKLERQLPKTEILNRYLNAVYFGRGAYGVEAASKTYFGKDVGSLTLPEAAYLAGLIRSPETADAGLPASDPGAANGLATAKFRRTSVLDNMFKQHYITQAERDAAVASPWTDVLPKTQTPSTSTVTHTELGTQYLLDYVRHTLVASGQFNDAELYGGGLRIYTTIDYGLQKDALDAITSNLRYKADPAASLVSIDPSGRIRAMASSTSYATSQVNLAVGSQGGGGGRQAGSTFKTFAVAEALSQGMSLNQTFPAPYSLTVPNGMGQGQTWPVHNDNHDENYGRINMSTALAKSINTYFAGLVTAINPQNLENMAKRMGVASPSLEPIPSLVLGTRPVSVLDMASGYSTLMDEGVHITPYIVSRVTDSSGQVLYQAPTSGSRVLSKNVADQVNWALSQVITQGTGTKAAFGQPAAGKTGTTDKNTDGWFTGYTCSLTASVWIGYPDSDNHSMTYLGANAYGGQIPATIWNAFMTQATQGLKSCPYNRPANASGSVNDYGTGVGTPSTSPSGSTTTTGHVPSSTTTTAPVTPTTVAPPTTVTPTTVTPTTVTPTTLPP